MIKAFETFEQTIISDVEKEALEEFSGVMTESTASIVAKYGVDMYLAGLLDWCGKFFIAGGVTGAAVTGLMVLAMNRKQKSN